MRDCVLVSACECFIVSFGVCFHRVWLIILLLLLFSCRTAEFEFDFHFESAAITVATLRYVYMWAFLCVVFSTHICLCFCVNVCFVRVLYSISLEWQIYMGKKLMAATFTNTLYLKQPPQVIPRMWRFSRGTINIWCCFLLFFVLFVYSF